jgi:hypothetical protein
LHRPLCPAPFPPLVGGLGLANAGRALASAIRSASVHAGSVRYAFLLINLSPLSDTFRP